ncbi:BQ5605_C019g08947 [Microbotryum silenes-dioicae]|uniref:BQ5605_C019g08947 protein n=1 Tax=Microbotryum silenes-dioicae TaxID=796604 RepID=A0A2X0LW36_9BASI|nr:BQ5605_C019g08947 [Microbotryum silenes-dioicae]
MGFGSDRSDVEESFDQVQSLTGDVRDEKDGARFGLSERTGQFTGHTRVFDENGGFATPGRAKDLDELFDRLFEYVRGGRINFGHHTHDGHGKCQRDREMFFAHPDQSCVRPDDQEHEIG